MTAFLLCPLPSAAQERENPYTLAQVLELLRGGVAEQRILEFAVSDCINFRLDLSERLQLRNAGATPAFVSELATVCVRLPAPDRSTSPTRPPNRGSAATPAGQLPAESAPESGRATLFGGLFGGVALPEISGDTIPVLVVGLQLGAGYPALGIQVVGGVMFADKERQRTVGVGDGYLVDRPAFFVGGDIVLLPKYVVYGVAGLRAVLGREVSTSPRFGAGVRLPTNGGSIAIEVAQSRRLQRFWLDGVPQIDAERVLEVQVAFQGARKWWH